MKKVRGFKIILLFLALVLLLIGSCFFLMEFIPVKYAIENKDASSYICYYEPKTNGPDLLNWTFLVDNEDGSRTGYEVKVIGETPYDVLNYNDFEPISHYNLPGESMGVVFYGDIVEADLIDERYDYIIYSTGWEIVGPIKRSSFRNKYVSKDYLTIYDFNKEEQKEIVNSWFD